MKCVVAVTCFVAPVRALDNGLARTPQMGYNSWYDLECSSAMNEEVLKTQVDAMIEKGLLGLGYNYFNLDDCWAKGRNDDGSVYADVSTFPSGDLKALADYVHDKGMLFGTYTDRGSQTCAGRPGADGYETIDAQTYAAWGVDYLKEDSCYASGDHEVAFTQYGKMRDALNATGRPILFSVCGWNDWYAPVGASLGNSWRTGPDDTNWAGVLKNIDILAGLEKYAGPGGWNDPCLLLSKTWQGHDRITELQARAQFSMWAVVAAPLLISGSITEMSNYTLATYSNADVIAVNQDPLGKAGSRIYGSALNGGGPWGSNSPAGATPCSGDESQQWEMDSPYDRYVQRPLDGSCLNVDNCGSDLIIWGDCPNKNCCDNCDNMRFSLTEDGTLKSSQSGEPCVIGKLIPGKKSSDAGLNLFLDDCDESALRWKYSAENKTLSTSLVSGAQLCLGSGDKGVSTALNVWARPLADGSHALVFLNAGSAAADVTCGLDCFAAIGVSPSDTLSVRDLWAPWRSMPDIQGATLTAEGLEAHGGHLMVIVAPKAASESSIHI